MRELTVAALAKTYRRLNVQIDHYHGESMYPIDRALAPFQDHLQVAEDGKKVGVASRHKIFSYVFS